jgi:hypothetical protein
MVGAPPSVRRRRFVISRVLSDVIQDDPKTGHGPRRRTRTLSKRENRCG